MLAMEPEVASKPAFDFVEVMKPKLFALDDTKEGQLAFAEKRKPVWTGR
jgi:hypothetical protein